MLSFQSFFNSKLKIILIFTPILVLVILIIVFLINQNQSSQDNQKSLNFSISNSQILSNNNPIFSTNSTNSSNSNSPREGWTQGGRGVSFQAQNSPISSQQNSSNSKIQPLIADQTHDVVVLEECNLAVRFSKKYPRDDQYSRIENFVVSKFAENSYSIVNINPTTGKSTEVNSSGFVVKCQSKNSQTFGEYQKSFASVFHDKDILSKLGKTDFNTLESLFTGESRKMLINSKMDENYTPGFIFLETKDRFYTIIGNKDHNLARLDNIQFNSLAPSTPTIKL